MRYPIEETAARHERIVSAASRLFRERGFDGVSVAEVMQQAGLTHGGFYAHFDSKEDLAAAGLVRALDEMLALADRAAADADPRTAFARQYLSRLHRDHPEQGCAMAALAPEVARRPGAVRRAFTDKVAALVDRVAGGFGGRRRGAARGQSARGEAITILSTLVGAVVLARAVDDPAFSDEILTAARARFGVEPETPAV